MVLSFWTDKSGQPCTPKGECLIRVYIVCHCVCIFRTHFSFVKISDNYSNFSRVQIFRNFMVVFRMPLLKSCISFPVYVDRKDSDLSVGNVARSRLCGTTEIYKTYHWKAIKSERAFQGKLSWINCANAQNYFSQPKVLEVIKMSSFYAIFILFLPLSVQIFGG